MAAQDDITGSAFDFPRFTGKGVKVAVVDSGIRASHPKIGRVCGGISILKDEGGDITFTDELDDALGHGTACAGIIRDKAPDVELYSVKIFHDSLSASTEVLIEAIRWCIRNGVDVVNLSLGTTKREDIPGLMEVCRQAEAKRVILVAAEHNRGIESYPAAFPNVISVAGEKIHKRYGLLHRTASTKLAMGELKDPNGARTLQGPPRDLSRVTRETLRETDGSRSPQAPFRALSPVTMGDLKGPEGRSIHNLKGTSITCPPGKNPLGRVLPTFIARGDKQRLAWIGPDYVFKGSTSFAAPHVTGLVALILEAFPHLDIWEVADVLIASSEESQEERKTASEPRASERKPGDLSWMRKAAIYPYDSLTKELIRFRHMLPFMIVGVSDPVGGRMVGKDAGEAIGSEPARLTITNRLKDSLKDAEALILGDIRRWGRPFGRDHLAEVLDMAIDMNVNVYSLAAIPRERYPRLFKKAEGKGLTIRSPMFTQLARELLRSREPEGPDVPVIGIFSAYPGLDGLEVGLLVRKGLLERGCKVGVISTNPLAELFGFDICLPPGSLRLERHEGYLEAAMKHIALQKVPHLILAEAPSGLGLPTLAFLSGTRPDRYVVLIQGSEDRELIRRFMNTLESVGRGKVIALVLTDEGQEKTEPIEGEFGIPVVSLSSKDRPERLCQTVLEELNLRP